MCDTIVTVNWCTCYNIALPYVHVCSTCKKPSLLSTYSETDVSMPCSCGIRHRVGTYIDFGVGYMGTPGHYVQYAYNKWCKSCRGSVSL